jgi:AcrR family transcriptional regulator
MAAVEKPDSKDRLMTEATRLFAQSGYDGVTVKEIAEAAGLNISLVSYYFSGKEGIYRACLESFAHERLLFIQKLMTPPTSRADFCIKIREWVVSFIESHLQQSEITCIIHRDCMSENEVIQDVFKKSFLVLFTRLVEFFKQGIEAKVVLEKCDPMMSASLFQGALVHSLRMDAVGEKYFGLTIKTKQVRESLADHLVQMVSSGILTEEKK